MDSGQIVQLLILVVAIAVAVGGTFWKLITYVNKAASSLIEKIDREKGDLDGKIDEQDRKRSDGIKAVHKKIEDTSASLDQKYNMLMLELGRIKDNYVRRDDLEGHLQRLERAQGVTAESIDALRDRIDRGFLEFTRALAQVVSKSLQGDPLQP